MQNLFTFGCSNTFGMALPDRGEQDLVIPETFESVPEHTDTKTLHGSKFAWGQVLADRLDMNCVNRGVVGAGIKETLWHFDRTYSVIKPKDIVCFLWPSLWRYNLLQETDIRHGRQWVNDHYGIFAKENWFKIFNPYDSAFTTHAHIQYVHLLLKEMNVQSCHMFSDEDDLNEIPDFYTDVNIITDTNFNKIRNVHGKTGLDNGNDMHGGVQTHEVIADAFYQQLITRVGAND